MCEVAEEWARSGGLSDATKDDKGMTRMEYDERDVCELTLLYYRILVKLDERVLRKEGVEKRVPDVLRCLEMGDGC